MKIYDVLIIGGGPAGLMAANVCEKRKLKYMLLDANPSVGKKLLITGNGRCNVTNRFDNADFINELSISNRRFLYSTIHAFGTTEVIEFLRDKGVELILENDIKYFPKSSKSSDILSAFTSDISKQNTLSNTYVKKINKNDVFNVITNKGTYVSNHVILATGSASFPQTGSDGFGAKMANALGHSIIPFYPAETNMYSGFISSHREFLQGIAIRGASVHIKGVKKKFTGDLLFTHFGLSGPVIQAASEYMYHAINQGEKKLSFSLTNIGEKQLERLLVEYERESVVKVLEKILIKRIAKFIVKTMRLEKKKVVELGTRGKQKLIRTLRRYEVTIDRVEHKEKAYVNGGGVSIKEINPKTMESKLVKGLYFAGEVIDVHGPIGGFNITIALSTGFTAASSIDA